MHTLPPLPYGYDALEPVIDTETMRLHHTKHHQTYVDKLNAALESHPDLATKSAEDLISDLDRVPENIRTAVRNHGGGHANHSLFWTLLAPAGSTVYEGSSAAALINSTFGSLDEFKKQFTAEALGLFGSGWVWLVKGADGKIAISKTANQDSPLMAGATPVLGLDVWEHAYYLKYQNRRAEYVENWFGLINWSAVSALVDKARINKV